MKGRSGAKSVRRGFLVLSSAVSRYLLAIDQGTTGSTALVMGTDGVTLAHANFEFSQHFPQPSWVEHEPEQIWESVTRAVSEALRRAQIRASDIAAIGITNQRETTLLWDRESDRPLHRALVWQDRRTAPLCDALRARGHEARVRATTGLVLDPYFSGTKINWLLEHVPGARESAERGDALFGTVDSYLVWRLAGGARRSAPHVTDVTNASRTLLMNLATLAWDEAMCEMLSVPRAMLPRIVPSAAVVATTRDVPGLPDGIPIAGMAGDQHAALFGQACFGLGEAKCTYGTGAFLLANTGARPVMSRFGLLTTLAWQIGNEVSYALEGSSFVAGAAVQWLRDGLGIIESAPAVEALAATVESSDGVVFVPALAGLGAPYWDAAARGLITGITRGTTRAHLARATLEAIAFQVDDLLRALAEDLGHPVAVLRVDGGAAANDLLMQLQADLAGVSVERPNELESTARGAAMLAGVGAGIFANGRDAAKMVKIDRHFEVRMEASERQRRLVAWQDAVRRARST
ncbi:MAG TPA: glycerol kinase GlpK [Polyangiaceae bacterium]|nr:glycerol kinase GlpK [Polyangiaceae bacterium]